MPLNDVPQTNQNLQQTQNPIRQNFQNIGAAWIIDHVNFGVPGQGQHQKVTLPMYAVGADPANAVNNITLYAKDNGTGNPGLFVKTIASLAGVAGVDFTTCLAAPRGWAKLACGIIIQWGVEAPAGGGLAHTNFPIPFPTNVFSIVVTPFIVAAGDGNQFTCLHQPYNAAGFNVWGSQRTTTNLSATAFSWIAIGI